MLSKRTYFTFLCALVLAGCADPGTSNGPSPSVKSATLAAFVTTSQHPLRQWQSIVAPGHEIGFNSLDELIVVNPGAPDPGSENGCAEILKFAKDGTLAATIPYDKSNAPVAPFLPCAATVNIAIDSKDAVAIAGMIPAPAGGAINFDIMVRKLDNNGNTLWTQYQYGKIGYVAYLSGLKVDANDNIVVATLSGQDAGPTRPQVAKYDPQGNVLWTHALANPIATGIQNLEIDGQNNIWLDVITENPNGRYLERLSPEGTELTPITLEGPLGRVGNDFILMNDDGVQKYSLDGKLLWDIPLGNESAHDEKGRSFANLPSVSLFAPDGSLYGVGSVKVGSSPGSLGIDIIVIVQRSSDDGSLLNGWSLELPGASNHVYDRAIGKDGRVAFRHNDFVGMVAPFD